jgi:hypothetical protein
MKTTNIGSLPRRRLQNRIAFTASTLATLLGLAILCAILWTLIS